MNGDGVPDLLIGAPGTGAAAGHAYVISGRTYHVIRVLSAHRPATSSASAPPARAT